MKPSLRPLFSRDERDLLFSEGFASSSKSFESREGVKKTDRFTVFFFPHPSFPVLLSFFHSQIRFQNHGIRCLPSFLESKSLWKFDSDLSFGQTIFGFIGSLGCVGNWICFHLLG